MNVSAQMYRSLVIASFVFAVCSALVDIVFPQALPSSLIKAHDDWLGRSQAGSLFFLGIFGIAIIVASIIATGGLCLFKSWARPLAVSTTIASFPFYPLAGPMLQSGWTGLFVYLSALCWGAAIALAYTRPIDQMFEAKS